MVITAARTQLSWRCEVLRWHRWRARSTDDGLRYAACTRCGRDWDGTSSMNSGGYAAAAFVRGR